MPTPNTYDLKNMENIIEGSGNIFHQTSIKNLAKILSEGAIYAPGSLWGLSPSTTTSIYTSSPTPTRLRNLKHRAENGFIDYIFCSFENMLTKGMKRYGTFCFEINRDILLTKESFIYPFNFVFNWNTAPKEMKYSDMSTWHAIVTSSKKTHELLIRRKISIKDFIVKFHCTAEVKDKAVEILTNFGYSEDDVVVYSEGASMTATKSQKIEVKVEIDGVTYPAIYSPSNAEVSVFEDTVTSEEAAFIGCFEVNEHLEIKEPYLFGVKERILGKVFIETNNTSKAI